MVCGEWFNGTGDESNRRSVEVGGGQCEVQRWSYRELFSDKLGFDPIHEPVATLQRFVADVDASLAHSLLVSAMNCWMY